MKMDRSLQSLNILFMCRYANCYQNVCPNLNHWKGLAFIKLYRKSIRESKKLANTFFQSIVYSPKVFRLEHERASLKFYEAKEAFDLALKAYDDATLQEQRISLQRENARESKKLANTFFQSIVYSPKVFRLGQ